MRMQIRTHTYMYAQTIPVCAADIAWRRSCNNDVDVTATTTSSSSSSSSLLIPSLQQQQPPTLATVAPWPAINCLALMQVTPIMFFINLNLHPNQKTLIVQASANTFYFVMANWYTIVSGLLLQELSYRKQIARQLHKH